MAEGVFESVIIGAGETTATLSIVNGELSIHVSAGVTGIRLEASEITATADSLLRLESSSRFELHADDVVRVDAGGVGFTLTPGRWEYFYPWAGVANLPAPPEHPDTGGNAYAGAGADYAERLTEYYARFPHAKGD